MTQRRTSIDLSSQNSVKSFKDSDLLAFEANDASMRMMLIDVCRFELDSSRLLPILKLKANCNWFFQVANLLSIGYTAASSSRMPRFVYRPTIDSTEFDAPH